MKADLHIHTTVSDGAESIASVIAQAKEKALGAIAITEHDTISHFKLCCDDAALKVLCGVEISAVHKETNTRAHILGYNIKTPEPIEKLCEPILAARNSNSEKQAEILTENGYYIELSKLSRADGKYLYKQHIMDWLVATGQAESMFGETYMRIFKNGGICDFDILYPDAIAAIAAIKEARGLAVLAHPGQQQNFWLVGDLADAGLDGIELNHHSHSEEDRKMIKSCANEHRLFLTGGSDYHGAYEPQPYGIGDFLSDESGVQAICCG
ncbi:MAG: PHP domain-containing protein [Eubacteriaceae bacterium]|nr:PHP domain-containing protein [Eubacteriaceae bacterium]